MQLMTEGMTNRQIAGHLCVTVHAVKFHLASIYRKFEVHNRTEAVVAFLEANGALKPPSRRIVDLNLYLRVLWRFRLIVAIGLVLAISLAFASLVKVGFAHGSLSLSYRQQPTWQSTTRLFVTQEGFPWGRSVFPTTSPTTVPPTGNSASSGLEFADPDSLRGSRRALRTAHKRRPDAAPDPKGRPDRVTYWAPRP